MPGFPLWCLLLEAAFKVNWRLEYSPEKLWISSGSLVLAQYLTDNHIPPPEVVTEYLKHCSVQCLLWAVSQFPKVSNIHSLSHRLPAPAQSNETWQQAEHCTESQLCRGISFCFILVWQGYSKAHRGLPEELADEVSTGGDTKMILEWRTSKGQDKSSEVHFKRLGNTLDPEVPNLCVIQAHGFPSSAS